MTNALEVKASAESQDRKLRNQGRKMRDWTTENEHYPRRIARYDVQKLEEGEEDES